MGRKRNRESRQVTDIHSSPRRKKVRWGSERYSSSHRLLLVGEGDFSFSLSLANTFGSATNIFATSKDSQDAVQAKFGMAKRNLDDLQKMGAQIFHEVDATSMDLHYHLRILRFDRIIFNFPHAGFMGKEDQMEMINLHRQLVFGFFRAAANLIKPHGEIHVSHKIGYPYDKWELEELASECSLQLIECSQFTSRDYPGYENKRGAGKSPDLAFRLGSCCTFKFKIYDARQEFDRLRKCLVPGRLQESTGMEFTGERIPNKADQFFAILRDCRAFIERSYAQIVGFGNPLLFNSPSMARMRDDGQFSAILRDCRTLIERSYTQIIGFGNPLLFNSPSMARVRDDGQFSAIPRDYCTLIEPSYTQRGVYGNPLLFNSQSVEQMREDDFCKTVKYYNGKIILDEDQFFAMRRTSCASLWIKQNDMQRGGHGIPLLSGSNTSSFGLIFPGAPIGERNGCYD